METEALTTAAQSAKMQHDPPRAWIELRSDKSNKLLCKFCAQTMQLEFFEKGERTVIELPKA